MLEKRDIVVLAGCERELPPQHMQDVGLRVIESKEARDIFREVRESRMGFLQKATDDGCHAKEHSYSAQIERV